MFSCSRNARPFQGADHRPIVLALAHGNLIGAQDRDAIQRPLGLDLQQGLLIEGLHRGPMQQHQSRDGSTIICVMQYPGNPGSFLR